MVCEGETSRLEVAHELLAILGLDKQIRINEVSSDYFKNEFFAPRPDSERLINRKLKLRELNLMRDWRLALKEYLEGSYRGYL
jgi:dTDP-4-dehydrorhamnose reductase